ncbi:TMEM165/GDT1 family protein [Shewanella sp. NIFS-20-20]|uniref:TMEM165/GDT1 family protein n=1 Tax=Shewanella sp. NIFS-20-20 TaxID=2853806 RepID=UPI001C4418CE|nr:TMEM165/GDT1 family protein [Shewanella sp. NIFS-20-20]MBV7314115.1 TMEM165/GDT1 family protein [Shewanella sp. NIFS-20-20]
MLVLTYLLPRHERPPSDKLWTHYSPVAVAEIGDKTQLLALLLAARFRNKTAIVAGILLATIVNHAAAASLGHWAMGFIAPDVAQYLLAASFFAIALWVLVPDKMDEEHTSFYRHGAFIATFILFFLAEMGDKTQVATVVLAGRFDDLWMVIAGTTIGMLLANVPVILIADYSAEKLPLVLIRRLCAGLFAGIGVITLFWQ